MFKALKDKLKGALGAFSKKVKEEAKEEVVEVEEPKPKKEKKPVAKVEKPEVKKTDKKPKTIKVSEDSKVKEEVLEEVKEAVEEPVEETVEEVPEIVEEVEGPVEKKGFFAKLRRKIATVELSGDKFEELFWELEVALLENNVALEVVEKIKEDLRKDLTSKRIPKKELDSIVIKSLKESMESLFDVEGPDLLKLIKKEEGPYVIAFTGINGSGKTTSMAKVAHMLMKNKLSVVFAAADTFRAASMEQLEEHADKLGIKMIKHDYQSDPAAVAFDAISHAKSKGIDVVLVDTAGRLHSNKNLMEELKKLIRVSEPDLKVFVGESTTGNDCVEQAREFDEAIGIDVIILTKTDVDEKGGAAISISFVTGKPIIYLGTGQTYDDLEKFTPEFVLKELF